MPEQPQLPHTDRQPPNLAFVLRLEASRLRLMARQLEEAADEHEKLATPRDELVNSRLQVLMQARAAVGGSVRRFDPT